MENYLIVGILALVFWSFQLAPQALENYKNQSTAGLSSWMILSWTIGSLATAIYNIGAEVGGKYGVLFVIQPNLFMFFSLICWTQCSCFELKSNGQGIIYGLIVTVLIVVVEFLGAFHLKDFQNGHISGSEWPFILLGAASLVFFVIGFVPQYIEFYRRKQVVGISLLFLAIDMSGSIFSVASLALQDSFEPIAGACYIAVFVLDLCIVLLHFILPLVYKPVVVAAIPSENVVDVTSC